MSGFSQLNPVPVAVGGTGSATAATARTALSAAASGANTDITSLPGPTVIGGTTPAAGSFTTGAFSSTVTLDNNINISMKDSGATARRMMVVGPANTTFAGPVDVGWGSTGTYSAGGALILRVNGASGAFTTAITLGTDASTTIAGTMTASGLTTATGTPSSICRNSNEITVNAALTCTVSSLDFKHDVESFAGIASDLIRNLEPAAFVYNDSERQRWGFISEQVIRADRRFGDAWDDHDIPRSIDQNAILAVTVKAVQDLLADNASLRAELAEIRAAYLQ